MRCSGSRFSRRRPHRPLCSSELPSTPNLQSPTSKASTWTDSTYHHSFFQGSRFDHLFLTCSCRSLGSLIQVHMMTRSSFAKSSLKAQYTAFESVVFYMRHSVCHICRLAQRAKITSTHHQLSCMCPTSLTKLTTPHSMRFSARLAELFPSSDSREQCFTCLFAKS